MLHTCTQSALARLDDQALRFSPPPLPPLAPPTRQPEYRCFPSESFPTPGMTIPPALLAL